MGMKASYLGGFNRAYVARPIALRRLPVVKKAEFVGNHFYDHFFHSSPDARGPSCRRLGRSAVGQSRRNEPRAPGKTAKVGIEFCNGD